MKAVIYHNTRCSKSRATLDILRERQVEPEIVNYLDTPPSRAELQRILGLLGKPAQAILRFSEPLCQELGIAPQDQRGNDEWIDILLAHPILIERPIVVIGERAVLGRPPENVLSIL